MCITSVFSAEAAKQLLIYLCFYFFSLIFLKIRQDDMNQDLRFTIHLCSWCQRWALPISHRQANVYDPDLYFFLTARLKARRWKHLAENGDRPGSVTTCEAWEPPADRSPERLQWSRRQRVRKAQGGSNFHCPFICSHFHGEHRWMGSGDGR